ncbi:unnamed protein product [marine sediment metagenome]|uniref:Uncharacterized protein n=1 Tax=marine sediment metagenome TaxID=412755 RepID=X1RW43_9ZZZZ
MGLMLRMAQVPQMKTVKIPDPDEIMMVWENLKKDFPGFSSFLMDLLIVPECRIFLPILA